MAKKVDQDLGAWLESCTEYRSRCPLCTNPKALALLGEILAAMAKTGKTGVSSHQIAARLRDLVPGFTATGQSVRRHCAEHDTAAWKRAKGRA